MKITKILALILAAILCVSVFAACGEKKTENEKKDDEPDAASTIAIKIVDNEGKTIYENKTLDIDPEEDGTEEGKLFLENVLALCNYYDNTLEYEFDSEGELSINGLTAIKGTVIEKIEVESEDEETEEESEEDKEPEYIEVEYCLFWEIKINDEEKSLDEEIKLGDNILLTFVKIPASEL